jgi:hypothetical protein
MIFVYTNNLTIQWLRLGIVVSYDFETYQSVYIYEVIPQNQPEKNNFDSKKLEPRFGNFDSGRRPSFRSKKSFYEVLTNRSNLRTLSMYGNN